MEEQSIVGGLSRTVAELLGAGLPVAVLRMGIKDTFTDTGSYDVLFDGCGMSVDGTVSTARQAMNLGV